MSDIRLAVAHTTTPYLTVYNRVGDVLTKIADPAILPAGTGQGTAWSPDGSSLAVAHYVSPYLTVYNRVGDVLTKIADPAILPAGTGFGVTWSETLARNARQSGLVAVTQAGADIAAQLGRLALQVGIAPEPDEGVVHGHRTTMSFGRR